jgi:hypothetical protein
MCVDDVTGNAPVHLRFLYVSANDLGDGAGARQQLWHLGFERR